MYEWLIWSKPKVSIHTLLSLLPSLQMLTFFFNNDHLDSLKNILLSTYLCAHFCVIRSTNGKLQILTWCSLYTVLPYYNGMNLVKKHMATSGSTNQLLITRSFEHWKAPCIMHIKEYSCGQHQRINTFYIAEL